MIDEKRIRDVSEIVEVKSEYFRLSLAELIALIIKKSIGRNVGPDGRVPDGKTSAWAPKSSKGFSPSSQKLRDIAFRERRQRHRKIKPDHQMGFELESLKELIRKIEINSDDWCNLIDSVFRRTLEGGSDPDKYDISGFFEKFKNPHLNCPLFIGGIYLDITLGDTDQKLSKDSVYKGITYPQPRLGGSIYICGKRYHRLTDEKINIVSFKADNTSNELYASTHRSLIDAQINEGKWINQAHFSLQKTPPVSFQIHRTGNTWHNDATDTVAFNYTAPLEAVEIVDNEQNEVIASWAKPKFIYTSVPARAPALRDAFDGPIICANGYLSSDGRDSGFRKDILRAYHEGHADLIIGNFAELMRTWNFSLPDDPNNRNQKQDIYDRLFRRETLINIFAKIPRNVVIVSRCFNYKLNRLDLYIYANGICRDCGDYIETSSLKGDWYTTVNFFQKAREYDAALIANIFRSANASRRVDIDPFNELCDAVTVAAKSTFGIDHQSS